MKDLTNLKTFIIDSKNPKEIDDAISLEITEKNANYIWIHVSYPSKLFNYDSEMDKKARSVSSSSYLIDNYIPMLPKEIIEEANLHQNKISETISARIELNKNGSINNYEIIEAIIKPNYALTYEDANELIELQPEQEYELIVLNKLLKRSLNYRKENGAIIFDTPFTKLSITDNKVTIERIEQTYAHNLVSEAMILMGHVVSDFLIKNKIPAPFRSQKINCDSNGILDIHKNSTVKYSILKQYIGKSFISIKPNKHETLGLNSYIQSTSPLRRYLDLIVQRQIQNYLNNEDILDEQTINELIDISNIKTKENNNILKEDRNYYLRKFFVSNNTKTYKIVFIKWINYKKNIALVYFLDYYLETLINLFISINTYTSKIYNVKFNNNENSNLLEFIH